MNGYLVADSFVSIAAASGLLVLIAALRRRHPGEGLVVRLSFGLGVLAVMLASRVLVWWGAPFPFNTLTLTAAGLVPLAALLFCEGLLRRHAPKAFKWVATAGALVFAILAWLPTSWAYPWRTIALLVFQLAGFLAMAWLLLARDRTSLSALENRSADRIALSLLLILPLLATDFRFPGFPIPVRLAGIAILAFCWLAQGLGRGQRAHRDSVRAFVAYCASALAAGGAVVLIAGLDATTSIQVLAVCCAAVLLGAIVNDAFELRAEEQRRGMLRLLAQGDLADADAFLGGLQRHAQIDGLLILREAELGDFDRTVLEDVFARHPLLRSGQVGTPEFDEGTREQLDSLMQRYGASHLMRVSIRPLTLAALNMPVLADAPIAQAELAAVQRMAQLVAERRRQLDPAEGT
ncbi:hypothetical protein ABIE51_003040 [Lysobacter sp. OAE881]